MPISLVATGGTSFSPYLIGDLVTGPSQNGTPGIPGQPPLRTPCTVNGLTYPVSAILELQGSSGGFLPPRMTVAQRGLLVVGQGTQADGLMVFTTDTQSMTIRQGGVWFDLAVGNPGGPVVGPNPSVVNGIATWANAIGTVLLSPDVTITPGTDFVVTNGGFTAAVGSAAIPSFSFTGDTDTGLYHIGAGNIGVSAGGVLALSIAGAANVVNTIAITASATTQAPSIAVVGTDANIGLSLVAAGNGVISIAGSGAQPGTIAFCNAANNETLDVQAAAGLASYVIELPAAIGTADQVMAITGIAGNVATLSFVDSAIADGVTFDNTQGAATVNGIPSYVDNTGLLIQNTAATVSEAGDITAALVEVANGAANAPTYRFATADCGVYRAAAETLGISGNGLAVATFQGVGAAVNLLEFINAATGGAPVIKAAGTDPNITLDIETTGAGGINFANGTGNFAQFVSVTAPANYIQLGAVVTTLSPTIAAVGSDPNIALLLFSKGTGSIDLRTTTGANSAFLSFQSGDTANTFSMAAPANLAANVIMLLPPTEPEFLDCYLQGSNGGQATAWVETAVSYERVTVTAAQFQTLHTAAVEMLVPAGNGFAYVIQNAVVEVIFTDSPEAGTATEVLLTYGAATGLPATANIPAANFTGAAASCLFSAAGQVSATFVASNNVGIYLYAATGDFGIDGTSTYVVHIWYRIIAL